MEAEVPVGVVLMLCILSGVNGNEHLNLFISDIITEFRLTSALIIYSGDIPEICMTHHWLLCLDQEGEQEIILDVDNNKETNHGKPKFI